MSLLEPLFAPAFVAWGAPFAWLEIVAFVAALAMVWCNLRVHVAAWPLAIFSSLLYCLLFWKSRLYGEAGLQLFFVAIAGWGWWQWLRGTDAAGRPLVVRRLGPRGRLGLVVAIALAWSAIGAILDRWTDTDVPWWDAFPTAASVVGQWLLGRKYVENWPTWLVVNVVACALFAHKGLWLTVIVYAVFAGLSVVGWRAWLGRTSTAAPAASP